MGLKGHPGRNLGINGINVDIADILESLEEALALACAGRHYAR